MSRFRYQGRIYEFAALTELSVRDTLTLQRDLAALGLPRSWGEVLEAAERIAGLDADKRLADPDLMLTYAAAVWAARRVAGDTVSFDEVLDMSLAQVENLPETADFAPAKKGGEGKNPRKASARGGGPRPGA